MFLRGSSVPTNNKKRSGRACRIRMAATSASATGPKRSSRPFGIAVTFPGGTGRRLRAPPAA